MRSATYRFPVKLLEAMKIKAKSEHRSVNAMLEVIIIDHCRKELAEKEETNECT
jgi:hypothetical protein